MIPYFQDNVHIFGRFLENQKHTNQELDILNNYGGSNYLVMIPNSILP